MLDSSRAARHSSSVPYTIDTGFPGGNAIIESFDGDLVKLRPDLRDTVSGWFYWCFRVRGAAGRTLAFHFTQQDPIGARGPAISRDGGQTWQWLGREAADDSHFSYAFPVDADEVFFGMGMTYTLAHLDRFLEPFSGSPFLRRNLLCHSRAGRPVHALHLGRGDGADKRHILITARHHACEMMCSYAVEGIIAAALAEDSLGHWFQDHAAVMIVPFMDTDGVEQGDQGKHRSPYDHNRDYSGESIYHETAALRRVVPQWLNGAPLVQLDLHCPWLRGGINELFYQVGRPDPQQWRNQQRFGQCLAAGLRGPIPYDPTNDLPFGQGWNAPHSYQQGSNCTDWGGHLPHTALASTIELPYANAGGVEVNQSSARAFGQDLARGLHAFITST